MKKYRVFTMAVAFALLVGPITSINAAPQARPAFKPPSPKFSTAVAFDTSPALRDVAAAHRAASLSLAQEADQEVEVRPDRGPVVQDQGFSGDAAVRESSQMRAAATALTIPAPLLTFEGLSNQDNFNTFGFRVNPPDPNGDVGPNH